MVADNLDRQAFLFAKNPQLDQQAFAQVTRRNARRIEVLNDFERFLYFLERMFAALPNFFERDWNFAAVLVNGAQITILIQISDDRVARDANVFFHRRQAELPFEMVRECLRFRQEVLERGLFKNFRFARTRSTIVQVLIEALKIDVAIWIVYGGLGLRRSRDLDGTFRGRLRLRDAMIASRSLEQCLILGICSVDPGGSIRCLLIQFDLRSRALDDFSALFEHWVLNQLLLDHICQLKFIECKQAHHLNQTRGENLLLGKFCD